MSQPARALLRVEGLRAHFGQGAAAVQALRGVDLQLRAGRTLGLVGESGSGKSVTALTVMRLLPVSATVEQGHVSLLGRDLLAMSSRQLQEVRGRDVSMVFQEPMTALNPVMRVGEQVAEAIVHHERVPREEALRRAASLLQEVGLDRPEERCRAWPHQLSGGQKQRVVIAMALACDPRVLVADEPTTALDVTVQARILDLLRRLQEQRGMAVLFITHDLGVVAQVAHEVAVMREGRVVEHAPVLDLFTSPSHPYTRGLLACRPSLTRHTRLLPTVQDHLEGRPPPPELAEPRGAHPLEGPPLLEVRGLRVWYPHQRSLLGRTRTWHRAVDGVDLDVHPGRTLGLVGESGCGKTTVGRAICRLVPAREGQVRFDDREVLDLAPAALRALRQQLQLVFQDPMAALNPRLSLEQALVEPMAVHGIGTRRDRRDRAAALLEEVDLDPDLLGRYPHQLSGGQRQRVCIARALALRPRLIILDESVSALDVSVQARILNLLVELQSRHGLAYLLISHDLSVIKHMSDAVAVMRQGVIVERGTTRQIYESPQQSYTRQLLEAVPTVDLQAMRARVGG